MDIGHGPFDGYQVRVMGEVMPRPVDAAATCSTCGLDGGAHRDGCPEADVTPASPAGGLHTRVLAIPAADWWSMRSQATTAEARVALLQTELEAADELLRDVWRQFAVPGKGGKLWAGGLSVLEDVAKALKL